MSYRRDMPDLIDTAERRRFVIERRKAGDTYQQIAEAAVSEFGADALPSGWDSRYAYKDVKRELRRVREDVAESSGDLLTLELERLDAMLRGLWPAATTGDERAVSAALRIMQRRAKLLGLDDSGEPEITRDDLIVFLEHLEHIVKRYITDPETRGYIAADLHALTNGHDG